MSRSFSRASARAESTTSCGSKTLWRQEGPRSMQVIRPKSERPNHGAALKERIANRTAQVGVVGAGYIGLPLAVAQAKAGFTVVAVDQNPIRVAQLNQGSNYLRDVDDADLASVVTRGKLSATTELDRIGE